MRSAVVHCFGPFEFDATTGRLTRQDRRIRLSAPQSAILARLLENAGVVVSKEALLEAGWQGMAITENSVDQAISRLRRILADGDDDSSYIETLPHRGYRFAAAVQSSERHRADLPFEATLEPFRAFVQGRTELDTLDRDAIRRARTAFEDAVRQAPDYAPAHVGLAMACALRYESTMVDESLDAAALETAVRHAREACALGPESGEAWSTLAFVLSLNGEPREAAAAACKAMALEPDDWRHALRAAYVSWGEERLRTARRVLALCPRMALAHWLRTTVFIARGAFDAALEEARAGCAAQDAQDRAAGFPAVGLHLLHALILAAEERLDAAAAELTHELSWADSGQLYARECAANTWYALGAVRLRQRRRVEADAGFTRALTIAPRHAAALAALRGEAPATAKAFDATLAKAIIHARANRHEDAARVYREALAGTAPGSTGWLLPVEPMLHPLARQETWADALSAIRQRAT